MERGKLIVIEGPNFSGKTSVINALREGIPGRSGKPVCVREPGGTEFGEALRSILKDPKYSGMGSFATALAFNAARVQLIDEVIRPALEAGKDVLCDRYYYSTEVYQLTLGADAPHPFSKQAELIKEIHRSLLQPDQVFFLMQPGSVLLERAKAASRDDKDRFEGNSEEVKAYASRIIRLIGEGDTPTAILGDDSEVHSSGESVIEELSEAFVFVQLGLCPVSA